MCVCVYRTKVGRERLCLLISISLFLSTINKKAITEKKNLFIKRMPPFCRTISQTSLSAYIRFAFFLSSFLLLFIFLFLEEKKCRKCFAVCLLAGPIGGTGPGCWNSYNIFALLLLLLFLYLLNRFFFFFSFFWVRYDSIYILPSSLSPTPFRLICYIRGGAV